MFVSTLFSKTAIPGGTPIIVNHCLIGAVGISGRRPEDDQQFADDVAAIIIQEVLQAE